MITDLQKRAAQSIVNIFETGRLWGDYGKVTVAKNDGGHLTYGRSQTTLTSGNLYLLVKAYVEAPGAVFAVALSPYLDRLVAQDLSLDHDATLRQLLATAGDDPVMRQVQDAFFDRVYWRSAAVRAEFNGIASALGTTVVYDSTVHGSWSLIRDKTIAEVGPTDRAGEKAWIESYVALRRAWLMSFDPATSLLPKTVYRMDELGKLIAAARWDLAMPFSVRGVTIDAAALAAPPPVIASAMVTEERLLRLREPLMRGEDVHALQEALGTSGFLVPADGIFGRETDAAVRSYQASRGLVPDGLVGPATRARLGL
jgi:chitosanase